VFKTVSLPAEVLLVLFDGALGYGNLVVDFGQGRVNLFTDVVIAGHQVVGHGKHFGRLVKYLCRVTEFRRYRYGIRNVSQMNNKRRVHGIHACNQVVIHGRKLVAG